MALQSNTAAQQNNSHKKLAGAGKADYKQGGGKEGEGSSPISRQFKGNERAAHVSTYTVTAAMPSATQQYLGEQQIAHVDRKSTMR